MKKTDGAILFDSVQRLGKPQIINSKSVIIIATIGIFINGFTAWLFLKGKKHDLNIRSAFVHFVADALVSFGSHLGLKYQYCRSDCTFRNMHSNGRYLYN